MKICLGCGYENADSAKFCSDCGVKIEGDFSSPSFCSECGASLENFSKFCPECGYNLEEDITDNDDTWNDEDDDWNEYSETQENKILAILDKWLPKITKESIRWCTKSNGTFDKYPQRIQNGLKSIGRGYIRTDEVLGFLDCSMMGKSGKDAIIFTEKGIAWDYAFEPIFVLYDDMTDIFLSKHDLHFGKNVSYLSHKNGKRWVGVDVTISDTYCNLTAFKDCLEEIRWVI